MRYFYIQKDGICSIEGNKIEKINKPMRKIKYVWTCNNFVHHQHRWKWSAWICGRIQYCLLIHRWKRLK